MNALSVLLLGLAMSTDAFAAAIGKGAGMVRPRLRQALKTGLIFGLIEATTPLLGWALGRAASTWLQAWDHWIAFALLAGLGAHMIYNGLKEPVGDGVDQGRRHGAFALALTGIATSIDALAVGVGLAFTEVPILLVAAVIGLCTFSMVTLGVMLGRALGLLVGRRAEIFGGVVLISVGVGVVWQHLGR